MPAEKKLLVQLSASVERFGVSRLRDFCALILMYLCNSVPIFCVLVYLCGCVFVNNMGYISDIGDMDDMGEAFGW